MATWLRDTPQNFLPLWLCALSCQFWVNQISYVQSPAFFLVLYDLSLLIPAGPNMVLELVNQVWQHSLKFCWAAKRKTGWEASQHHRSEDSWTCCGRPPASPAFLSAELSHERYECSSYLCHCPGVQNKYTSRLNVTEYVELSRYSWLSTCWICQ